MLHSTGSSNAHKIKIETFGFGDRGLDEIPLQIDHSFDFQSKIISVNIGTTDSVKTNTRIALYGTVGPPKLIILKN